MNKRARNRLIGVTVIVLVIIAAVFFGMNKGQGAYYKTVKEIASDPSMVGKRVQVGGPVVQGSWDKKTRPMNFAIKDEKGTDKLQVVYNGNVPNTFGDGVEAIVTGELKPGGVIQATELVTKCPEKKESATSAMSVDKLIAAKKEIVGVPLKVTGLVVSGSLKPAGTSPRFSIQTKDGVSKIGVVFDNATPAGFADGVAVVVGGSVDAEGLLDATSVALSK